MIDYNGLKPATILSYDKTGRTAKIHIPTITDGIEGGITATFAYAVGDSDKDTEIQIDDNSDCYIFFSGGQIESPVIAFYRSHGDGQNVTDVRRIRQENIELLARANINIKATTNVYIETDTATIKAKKVEINAEDTEISGNLKVLGETNLAGETTIEGGKYASHGHSGVDKGSSNTGGVVK